MAARNPDATQGAGNRPLSEREIVPLREGTGPLTGEGLRALQGLLAGGWEVVGGHHLLKTFRFRDFREALDFTDRVGGLAEELNHHPDICLGWGRVEVTIFTHKIGGLHENDFVLAARIDLL